MSTARRLPLILDETTVHLPGQPQGAHPDLPHATGTEV